MSLNLGDVFVRFRVDTSGIREFQRSSQRLTRQTRQITNSARQAQQSTTSFNDALDRAARVAALTEGPLSGIASRLTTLRGLLNSGALAAAGFTAALGALVSSSVGATKTFLETEDSIVKLGNAIESSSRVGQTSIEELDKAAVNLAKRTLLGVTEAREAFSQALAFKNLPTAQIERFVNLTADVAAAFGGDIKGTLTQFAKGIEAPASALDGYNRKGVVFNKTQREVLQNLVDTGQQGKATEIILKTLEGRFKGFGKALGASGALDTLQVSIQIFREQIFRTTGAGDALQRLFETLTEVFDKFSQKGGLAERTGKLLEATFNGLSNAIEVIEENFSALKRVLETVVVFVGTKFVVATSAATAGTIAMTGAIGLLKAAFLKFLPFAVIAGLLELVDRLVKTKESVGALKKSFLLLRAVFVVTIRNLSQGFKLLSDSISPISESVMPNIKKAFENFFNFVKSNINTLVRGFVLLGKTLGVAFGIGIDKAKSFFSSIAKAWEGLKKIIFDRDLEGGLKDIGSAFLENLVPSPSIVSKLKEEFKIALKEVSDIDVFESGNLNGAVEFLKANFPALVEAFENFGLNVKEELRKSLVDGVTDGATLAGRELKNIDPVGEQIDQYLEEVKKSVNKNVSQFGTNFSNAIGDAIVGKEKIDFTSIAKDFVSQLFSTLISEILINPIVKDFQTILGKTIDTKPGTSLFGFAEKANKGGLLSAGLSLFTGFFGGGAGAGAAATPLGASGNASLDLATGLGGNFLEGFAKGGIPPVNKLSVVGEQGPELFIPRQRGRIVPNDELGGMGGQTINMTVVTRDAQSFRDSRNKIKSDLRGFVS